jgi:hypothetical protein
MAGGCKNADSSADISSGEIEATIDGKAWKGQGGTAVKQTIRTGSGTVTTVTVVAAKVLNTSTGESETLEVTIYGEVGAENIAKRSYNIASDKMPKAQFSFTTYNEGARVSYFGTEGTVKIDEISEDNIKGSFEGVMTHSQDENDTKKVTGGGFNIDFGYSFEY